MYIRNELDIIEGFEALDGHQIENAGRLLYYIDGKLTFAGNVEYIL